MNNIRKMAVTKGHVLQVIDEASSGAIPEGCVGAGTGTICFGWKGGIGTSSRLLPRSLGGFTLGVLVQTNFGGVFQMDGTPVRKNLRHYDLKKQLDEADGSIMIILATDAPLSDRNLKRGDRLVVALTADAFVGKGPGRPIQKWEDRAAVLGALRYVDQVVESTSAYTAILKVRPTIFVKGVDYKFAEIAADREACRIVGAQIMFTTAPKRSTTAILKRARECALR